MEEAAVGAEAVTVVEVEETEEDMEEVEVETEATAVEVEVEAEVTETETEIVIMAAVAAMGNPHLKEEVTADRIMASNNRHHTASKTQGRAKGMGSNQAKDMASKVKGMGRAKHQAVEITGNHHTVVVQVEVMDNLKRHNNLTHMVHPPQHLEDNQHIR